MKTPLQRTRSDFLTTKFTSVKLDTDNLIETDYEFKVPIRKPKTGLLIVGLCGNNGSTLYASLIANKHKIKFETRNGTQNSNFYGSLIQSCTVPLSKDVNVKYQDLLPFLDPTDLIVHGWDIYGVDLYTACNQAKVLEYTLKEALKKDLQNVFPMKSIFDGAFVAKNQNERANNHFAELTSKEEQLGAIRQQIRDFKQKNQLDTVVVLWSASTERMSSYMESREEKDNPESILMAIKNNHPEIAPSHIFACASILEGGIFINGAPQNTILPEIIKLAKSRHAFIAGNDFKTGQTKLKGAMMDFLVGSGIKVKSICSYNHLGNNDGLNLSQHEQFTSKEISKSALVSRFISENHVLYGKNETIDQTIVIKYIPAVGDSKRAMDEYFSEIFMGGHSNIAIHNICEDSLLAVPVMLDLVIVAEMYSRITYRINGAGEFRNFNSVMEILAFFLKSPVGNQGVYDGSQSLFRQRLLLENTFKAIAGVYKGMDTIFDE